MKGHTSQLTAVVKVMIDLLFCGLVVYLVLLAFGAARSAQFEPLLAHLYIFSLVVFYYELIQRAYFDPCPVQAQSRKNQSV